MLHKQKSVMPSGAMSEVGCIAGRQGLDNRGGACRFRGPGGARLLQRRGGLAVRKLAARLGGRAVLSMLSSILEDEQDLPFAAALVQALNLILLTAPEVGCPGIQVSALCQHKTHQLHALCSCIRHTH